MKRTIICLLLCQAIFNAGAQVATLTGGMSMPTNGFFGGYATMRHIVLPPFQYQLPTATMGQLHDGLYKFAEPVAVNINLLAGTPRRIRNKWVYTVKLRVPNALSLSVQFNRFYLPPGAEMYLYNTNGTEVTGPVTSSENNANLIWGSDVYEGDGMIIEVAVPVATTRVPLLNINSVSCGFRSLASLNAAARFGASGSCNINVSCPEGARWEEQKKSVALILDPNGGSWTGVLVNNTCNNRIPYILTAAHAALNNEAQPISKWRFVFHYWSNSCNPNQDGSQRLLFNGATLKAYSSWTDFALLQMNQVPDQFSGIVYAGWDRNSNPSPNAAGLHHPVGDVMKLAYDAEPLVRTNYPNLVGNVYWQADWNMGVTEVGSSGSPLFNSVGKVIGQLKGGYSFCGSGQKKDYYGCFDASWPGSGSPASRLRDWLDPLQTDSQSIGSIRADHYIVTGPVQICSTAVYNISNLPSGATVNWLQPSPANIASLSVSGNTATLTRLADGVVTLSAQVKLCGNTILVASYNIQVGAYPMEITAAQSSCSDVFFTASGNAPVASYTWTVGSGDLILEGGGTTATTSVPSVGASGTYGTVALSTANFCSASTNVYADYLPYRREFKYGMYQPILNGESLVASIDAANYVNEYRWYLNGQLVQSGSSTTYITNDFNLIQCGSNQLRVEGVTDCGTTEIAFDPDVQRACGNTFRSGLSANLSPNPASGQVRVDLKVIGTKAQDIHPIERVNVYDKLGLLKKQLTVKGMQQSVLLSVHDLPDGVYFVELISGGQAIKQTLVIKR